jgi:hypothetical protein
MYELRRRARERRDLPRTKRELLRIGVRTFTAESVERYKREAEAKLTPFWTKHREGWQKLCRAAIGLTVCGIILSFTGESSLWPSETLQILGGVFAWVGLAGLVLLAVMKPVDHQWHVWSFDDEQIPWQPRPVQDLARRVLKALPNADLRIEVFRRDPLLFVKERRSSLLHRLLGFPVRRRASDLRAVTESLPPPPIRSVREVFICERKSRSVERLNALSLGIPTELTRFDPRCLEENEDRESKGERAH